MHSKLWLKCPKVKFCYYAHVNFAAGDAVVKHNFGDARGLLLAEMNMLSEASMTSLKVKDCLLLQSTPKYPVRVHRSANEGAGPSDYPPGGF